MKARFFTRRVLYSVRKLLSRIETKLIGQRWIFVHLPKCGGTSISTGLRQALGAGTEGFIDPMETRKWARFDLPNGERAEGSARLFQIRLTLLRAHADRGVPFIYGHFPLDECLFARPKTEQHEQGYRWLTVLRDPVDRLLSQFRYWTLTREPTAAESLSSIERRWQAYLGSDLCHYHANLYSYYLGGHAVGFDGNRVAEMQERAQDNLKAFDAVGCIENLQAVAEDFRDLTGRSVRFRRLNSSEANSETRRQVRVLEEFEKRVDRSNLREMTRSDTEIYQIARK